MQTRTIIILLALFSFIASLWLVAAQRQELGALRAARTAAEQDGNQERKDEAGLETNALGATNQAQNLSPELLQLRSQVTLLGAQVRGLNFVTQENARLRGQLAAAAQNPATGIKLPAGYIRKNQAKQAGYRTPEDTLQSFFSGLMQRDVNHVTSALTPSSAERFQALQPEEFFNGADQVPGFAVRGRNELPDGTVELQVEIVPGLPTEPFRFQQVNGEWKLSMPF